VTSFSFFVITSSRSGVVTLGSCSSKSKGFDSIIRENEAYSIKIEIYGSTKADAAIINAGLSINTNILPSRGTLLSWGSNQNYMTGILQELPRTEILNNMFLLP
jgi:hypothetical protein